MDLKVTALGALKDNYIWAIINEHNKNVVVVDPGDAKPVLDFLASHHYHLIAILITHKHWDHSNGIQNIIDHYSVPVYGPICEALPLITHGLKKHDEIHLAPLALSLKVMHIPGHTLEHIAYYNNHVLFSGDTLFSGGCGRVFEGTYAQMFESLQCLANLSDETLVYCGHEYTQANLEFAQIVEPNNHYLLKRLAQVITARRKNVPTVPSTLAEEKLTNPFLRCHVPDVIHAVEKYAAQILDNPTQVFEHLRKWKNNLS
jgi:hydroxyacylglutathione hydrolase